jgi:hypothetical protein
MVIPVLNSNFLIVDIIKSNTYLQIADKARDVGQYEVHIPLTDETKFLLNKDKKYYLAFKLEGNWKFGYVQKLHVDAETKSKTMQISGKLSEYILTKRIIKGQKIFKGKTYEVISQIVHNVLDETDSSGNLSLRAVGSIDVYSGSMIRYMGSLSPETWEYYDDIKDIEIQQTGGIAMDLIIEILTLNNFAFDFRSSLYSYGEIDEDQWYSDPILGRTNVGGFTFEIIHGADRTKGNTDNNEPIIFKTSLRNLYNTAYDYDKTESCNIVYVAGEGEGNARTWVSFFEDGTDAKDVVKESDYETYSQYGGWNREELFVDARDVQSEMDEKTYTASEYKTLLKDRGLTELSEHITLESFEGSVIIDGEKIKYGQGLNTDDNSRFVYKGDWVTIVDEELGIEVDAQITEVTKTYSGAKEILDFTFGYKGVTFIEKLRRKGVL